MPHEAKANWTYELPFGRGRRFGANMHPILNGLLGNWQFSGNARVQTTRFRLSNVKLVGMSVSELSQAFKIRITQDASGETLIYSMPQDIIDNTRRAFSTDPTTANRYSAALGAPTGRYLAPSSDASCVAIYRGDCGAKDININRPLFTRVDLSVKKSFPFLRRGSIEIGFDLLNAFNNINFDPALTPGETAAAFQVTTAFRDINTTHDPGGRLGQLGIRINW